MLRVITMLDEPEIKAKKLSGQLWYEIDDIQDLDIASSMFTPDEDEKVEKIQARYGGYWRYPKLIDFCYLVNPYYPPQRLMDEIKASFERLVTQYPSGMKINSLLAAKNFGVDQNHILVGNGAAELIKCLMEKLSGKIGFIRPTFEEYPNRYCKEESVIFVPETEDFSYNADDLIGFFGDKEISTLVLINPDNPTGNYLTKADVLKLVKWCGENKIRIIVDESFVDFAEEEDSSLISNEILNENENLIVMKSISKSYGVPGLRLGVLASSDDELIAQMKKDVAIWNINSFAEFYMQIEENYKKDYAVALDKLKEARKALTSELQKFSSLRVIPSQANYITVELLGGITSKGLTKVLLHKHNIFIKDLSSKINRGEKQFVRIAVRNFEDNAKLVEALKKELK